MSQSVKAIAEKLAVKAAEAQRLIEKPDITADEVKTAQALGQECRDLRAQLDAVKSVGSDMADLRAYLDTPALKFPLPDGSGATKTIGYSDAGKARIEAKADGSFDLEQFGFGSNVPKAVRTGEYKAAYVEYIMRKGDDRFMSRDSVKALQEGIDDQGGYWVPPDFTNELIKREPTPTSVQNYVRRWQTTSDRKVFPKSVYTGASDDSNGTLYSTGARVTYGGEIPSSSTAIDATQPTPGEFEVNVYTAMAALSVTNNMLEDSAVAVQSYLMEVFGETMALEYDNRILTGDGVGKARGILANPSSSATGNEPQYVALGEAATLKADGIKALPHSIAPQYLRPGNTRFVMNWMNTAQALDQLKDGNGRYLWSSGINADGLASDVMNRQLLGFPVSYSEFMPNVGANTFPIIFGDLSAYWLVERLGMTVQILRETKAKQNQVEMLLRFRFGGAVAKPWALKVAKVAVS